MSTLLGYARVSPLEQNAALQHDALSAVGCWRVFTDHASGAKEDRPELGKVLEQLRDGDTLVVWRLDRLGRSLRHLIEPWPSSPSVVWGSGRSPSRSTPPPRGGRLVFHVFGALAEFESNLIKMRTREGMKVARAKGRPRGKKPKLTVRQE